MYNLQTRLRALEKHSAVRCGPSVWVRVIVEPDQTPADAVAAHTERFGALPREHGLILRHIVRPSARTKHETHTDEQRSRLDTCRSEVECGAALNLQREPT